MKSIRCLLGIHKEYIIEGFPIGARSPLIGGIQCDRCKRVRCASLMHRPSMSPQLTQAFDEARAWLERMTGHRVIGTFVWYR